jgi:nucleotide-binding universal stress UspA family protein
MKILLAVDGSDFTKRMLAYLGAHEAFLGADHQLTALVVTARVPPQVTHHISHSSLETYYADQAGEVLRPIKAFAEQHQWNLSTRHEVGHAAEVIAKAADEGRFDLLVLGSRGHSALGSLVMGSVASGVLARCKTPILLIR